ncbi:MAG: hypothetical protein A3A86_08170 [Elusimicrobia bacterium RIFCSPLOWO2_01_FULL_60_11]|nr:MAG: hypothetical protein A3A86_08170 [Elusimicrobia bacterium RIFCSPLOWO2_01_FULL_60_11]
MKIQVILAVTLFAASAGSAAAPKAKKAPPKVNTLSQLLLSSPWCSFSYNKISGASSTKRVQFFNNGTWADTSRYEGYSSGDAGTFSSQHDGQDGGRWNVEGEQLYMSGGDEGLTAVDLAVKRNSNGYPILLADGVEYSQCR